MGGIPACRSNSQRGSPPANHVALTANLLHGCFCVWHDTRALKYPHRTRELSCWSPCLATLTLYRRSVDDVTMTSPRDHGHNPRRAPDSPYMIYYTLPQTSCTWALMTPPSPGGPRTHNGQNVHRVPRTRIPAPSQLEQMVHAWSHACIALRLVDMSTVCGQSDLLQKMPTDLTSLPSLRTT